MSVVMPGYRCPSPQSILKRLQLMYTIKRSKLEKELSRVSDIAITNDGWSSRSQDYYISATAHFISENWVLKNYIVRFDGR